MVTDWVGAAWAEAILWDIEMGMMDSARIANRARTSRMDASRQRSSRRRALAFALNVALLNCTLIKIPRVAFYIALGTMSGSSGR